MLIPDAKEVISILKKSSKERTRSNISTVSRFFGDKKFFAEYVKEGNFDIIDQCSRELNLEVAEKDKTIITFGEFGYIFYIVITGLVNVYVPIEQTLNFTYVSE